MHSAEPTGVEGACEVRWAHDGFVGMTGRGLKRQDRSGSG